MVQGGKGTLSWSAPISAKDSPEPVTIANQDSPRTRLDTVRRRVHEAARAADRDPGEIEILAVSKAHPAARIRALQELGQRAFGENYLAEAEAKIRELADLDPPACWHFIGALQSNKTRAVAEQFDWVQTVDRIKIARRLSGQRPESLAPLQICLQVNVDGETQKAGCPPETVPELAAMIAGLPGLRLRGLMSLPRPREGFAAQREPFRVLRELYEQLRGDGYELDTLSMGMSGDLEAAVAEGANLLRIGTALFGPRTG